MLRKIIRRYERLRRARTADRLRAKFFELQRKAQPDAFIEVGAFDGVTSLEMRSVLPKARIVAFEANPLNYAHFSTLLDFPGSSVEYRHSAVADVAGQRTFKILKKDREGGVSVKSSLLTRKDCHREYEEVEVPCTTLDEFFIESMPSRSSLWIDVEGASREVLHGAAEVLKTAVYVLIEVEEQPFWDGQWLAEDVVVHLSRFGLIPIDRDYEYPQQYNILFARQVLK